MIENVAPLGQGAPCSHSAGLWCASLLERACCRRDDVRALLFDAVKGLDLVGSELTPAAARIIVEKDLVPVFLGS
jgi:hypothetical protein